MEGSVARALDAFGTTVLQLRGSAEKQEVG